MKSDQTAPMCFCRNVTLDVLNLTIFKLDNTIPCGAVNQDILLCNDFWLSYGPGCFEFFIIRLCQCMSSDTGCSICTKFYRSDQCQIELCILSAFCTFKIF